MASAIHQHELAIGIHICPPFWTSLTSASPSHPSKLSQSTRFELPASYSKFLPAICFTSHNVYISMLLLVCPPSPSHTGSTNLSLCLRLRGCPADRFISTIFLDSIYISINIWHLFFSFSLTSQCMTGSRFIHLTTTDSNSFLFMGD